MSKKLTTEEWITRAQSVHGDKYDYNLVEYVDSKTKVKIICREHGVFLQTPNSHISKYGCASCSHPNKTKTTQEFILDAVKIFLFKKAFKPFWANGLIFTKIVIIWILPPSAFLGKIPLSFLKP